MSDQDSPVEPAAAADRESGLALASWLVAQGIVEDRTGTQPEKTPEGETT